MAAATAHGLRGGGCVHTVFSDTGDGDLAVDVDAATLARRRARLAPLPWTWLRQEHGRTVHRVTVAGEHAGAPGDASVTDVPGAVLAVQVADCAPVLLWADGPGGAVVAAVHAGWRGLAGGVLPAAVESMRGLGAERIRWAVGPCISASAYEFSPDDLDQLSERLGTGVRGRTSRGRPALDVRAGVAAALDAVGVDGSDAGVDTCTAASDRHFSHRARGDRSRQAGLIWWEPAAEHGTAR